MERELCELLSVLMTGAREELKKVKKKIESLWRHETEVFKLSAPVVLEFLPKFDQIGNIANKEAFASGLSFFFLTLSDDYFEILKDFILKVIQHPNGHLREAIRNSAEWLYCSLTARAEPFVYPEGKELTVEQKNKQVKAREQYVNFVKEIETLIDKYDTEDEDVEYVDEMKPSINKSLQQLWNRLTGSRAYQKILESTRPIPYEIFMKRKEIERTLLSILKETKSDFGLEDIKDIIYNEDESDDMMKIVAMFDTGQGAVELQDVLDIVTNVWNYFPHKALGGLCPQEKVLGY